VWARLKTDEEHQCKLQAAMAEDKARLP
jgi:hypothetical protein